MEVKTEVGVKLTHVEALFLMQVVHVTQLFDGVKIDTKDGYFEDFAVLRYIHHYMFVATLQGAINAGNISGKIRAKLTESLKRFQLKIFESSARKEIEREFFSFLEEGQEIDDLANSILEKLS